MIPDLSVIIPARNELPHLWYCLTSVLTQQEEYWKNIEVIVVNDGSTDNTENYLSGPWAEKIRVLSTDGVGAPAARQLGAQAARASLLLFLDAHVLPSPCFFADLKDLHENWLLDAGSSELWDDMGSYHFPVAWDYPVSGVYGTHYLLTLHKNFWGDYVGVSLHRERWESREIAASGHAALLVRRDRFFEVGGFRSEMKGYGGEELYLDLKMARFGYQNRVLRLPRIFHCSQRKMQYTWTNDDLFKNNCLSAYIVGGPEYADSVLRSHRDLPGSSPAIWQQLYEEAVKLGEPERRWLNEVAPRTLEDVLQDFRERHVLM